MISATISYMLQMLLMKVEGTRTTHSAPKLRSATDNLLGIPDPPCSCSCCRRAAVLHSVATMTVKAKIVMPYDTTSW